MTRNGLLIDYQYCTGCHSCEVACKMEKELPHGKHGIQLAHNGPWKITDEKWENTFVPIPTDICDLCADRVAADKRPTCVQHCQASVIEYGTVEQLTAIMNKRTTRQVLFTL